MTVYVDVVMGLNFFVDFFLLLGTDRLCGCPTVMGRALGAAALGGIYGGVCLLPGFIFLGNLWWRLVVLGVMCMIAFGWRRSALRRGVLFFFLTMALGGIAQRSYQSGILGLLGAAAGLFLLCAVGFRGKISGGQQVPVMLRKGRQVCRLVALRDTGNTLIDPISGKRVLVVGSEIAWELFGITRQQLCTPLETMASGKIPGLRLIPYRSVGCSSGMLLAVALDEVEIDGQPSNTLVAFAPQSIGKTETYQALAGGI